MSTPNFLYLEGFVRNFQAKEVEKLSKTVCNFLLSVGSKDDRFLISVDAWQVPKAIREALSRSEDSNVLAAIQGELKEDSWNDKDGNPVRKLKVVANAVTVLKILDKAERAQTQSSPVTTSKSKEGSKEKVTANDLPF